MSLHRYRVAVLAATASFPAPILSQSVAERPAAPATGKLTTAFTGINSLRELADGRVLISDQRSGQLHIADFRTGRAEVIGRRGRGPGEYEVPGALFPLAGDSTLMVEPGSRRALVLVGSQVVSSLPPTMPAFQGASSIGGADLQGRLLVERRKPLNLPPAGVAVEGARDSAYLVLVSRGTGRSDTVGQARVSERRFEVSEGRSGGTAVAVPKPSPIAIKEPAILSPDGWVAVARRDPYRVDWRGPDGSWIRGQNLPYSRQRVDDAEKAFVMAQWVAEGTGRRRSPDRFTDWPAWYPPFANSSVGPILLTRDGKLAIRRSRTSRAPQSRYDVVDRTGKLVSRMVLPANQVVAGFGEAVVYVATTDDDGLVWLSRHPWP